MNADAAVITAVAGGLAALVQGLIPTSALNAGRDEECIALLVIALVFEVNCRPWVTRRAPALLLKLIPFESWKVRVWNVLDASAEKAWLL